MTSKEAFEYIHEHRVIETLPVAPLERHLSAPLPVQFPNTHQDIFPNTAIPLLNWQHSWTTAPLLPIPLVHSWTGVNLSLPPKVGRGTCKTPAPRPLPDIAKGISTEPTTPFHSHASPLTQYW
jgi:hypothetical protein